LKRHNEDYQSVIKWAREHPELFQPDKIVLFISLAGVAVSDLIVRDEKLAGAMMSCPTINSEYLSIMEKKPAWFAIHLAILVSAIALAQPKALTPTMLLLLDSIKQLFGLAPTYIRGVGLPQTLGVQIAPSAYPGKSKEQGMSMK